MNFYVYSILDPRKPGNYKYNDLEFSYEGEEFIIKNYNQFAKENNFSAGSLSNLFNQKIKQYKGWTGQII
jgi:hypothetical protein